MTANAADRLLNKHRLNIPAKWMTWGLGRGEPHALIHCFMFQWGDPTGPMCRSSLWTFATWYGW
jgi:hypothetical protein